MRERFAVDGVFAFGVGVAAVKGCAETGFSFHQMPFAALRAGYACVFGFFQRFNVFAFGVVGAADEFFACAAVFVNELSAALRALPAVELGLHGFVLGDAGGGLLGGFVYIARVVAFGIACAGDEASCAPEFDLQLVIAAFGAGFV